MIRKARALYARRPRVPKKRTISVLIVAILVTFFADWFYRVATVRTDDYPYLVGAVFIEVILYFLLRRAFRRR